VDHRFSVDRRAAKSSRQTASFGEAALVAADSLRSSKLRSFLTLLGIILATTTLIAVMSMIHGMDLYIANTMSSMGSDGFRVVKIAFLGNFDPKKYLQMQKRNPELSPDEYQYLKDHATLLSDFGMSASRTVKVSLGSQTLTDISLNGGTANWAALGNTQMAHGRYFTTARGAPVPGTRPGHAGERGRMGGVAPRRVAEAWRDYSVARSPAKQPRVTAP